MRFKILLRAESRRYLTNALLILFVLLLLVTAFIPLLQFKSNNPLEEQWLYSVPSYKNETELAQHLDRMQAELDGLPATPEYEIRRDTLSKSIPMCRYLLEHNIPYDEIMEFPVLNVADAQVPFFSMYAVFLVILTRLLCILRCSSVICSDFQNGTASWLYCDAKQVGQRLRAKQLLIFLAGLTALSISLVLGAVMLTAFPGGAPSYLLIFGGRYLRMTRGACLFWLSASLLFEYVSSYLFCCGVALLSRHIYGCFFTILGANIAVALLSMVTQWEPLGLSLFPALFLFHTHIPPGISIVVLVLRLLVPLALFLFGNRHIKKADLV